MFILYFSIYRAPIDGGQQANGWIRRPNLEIDLRDISVISSKCKEK